MLYHSLDLKFPSTDPRATDVRIMGEKMDHMNKIVEQVLDFARNTEPTLVEVDVNQLIDDLGLLTRHKLKNQNIEWIRKLEPNLPAVMADATQLEQAFLNLTLNAVEAMQEGGQLTIVTRTISLPRSAAAPTHVVIDFKDTGIGMSVEQRQRAFTSLLNTSKARGTGLGLMIVQRVVETHRGTVKIRSKEGKGTTFSIFLPL